MPTEERADQIFAHLCARSDRPGQLGPTLVLDASVDDDELGYADYGTRAVHVSPCVLTLSEDHVAALLAHELGHLAQGPPEASPRRQRLALIAVLTGFLCVLAGAVGTALATAETGRPWWTLPLLFGGPALALCGPASSLSLSRRAELRADRHAAALLATTPWDATAILRDAVGADDARSSVGRMNPLRIVTRLLASHPSHRRRLAHLTRP